MTTSVLGREARLQGRVHPIGETLVLSSIALLWNRGSKIVRSHSMLPNGEDSVGFYL